MDDHDTASIFNSNHSTSTSIKKIRATKGVLFTLEALYLKSPTKVDIDLLQKIEIVNLATF